MTCGILYKKGCTNMEYSKLLTHEELEFTLHAYETYLMYKWNCSRIEHLPDSEFDSDDCQMWIEDAIAMYLASIKKYVTDETYSHLINLKNSLFKKMNDADEADLKEQGYYKKLYSYGYVLVK